MRILKKALAVLLLSFLPLPIIVIALSSVTEKGVFSFPLDSFSWKWYSEMLTTGDWLSLLGISFMLAIVVSLVTTVLAFMLALVVSKKKFRASRLLETIVLLPLIFPNAALGVAFLGLLTFLGYYGTYAGLGLAHCLLTLPFAYRPISNALQKIDPTVEEAAMILGASPFTVLRTITLPMLRPGLVTALLFAFIISFDEATVTVFLMSPDVTTLPMRILTHIQESGSAVVAAISTFLVLITFGLVLILQKTVGLDLFVEVEGSAKKSA